MTDTPAPLDLPALVQSLHDFAGEYGPTFGTQELEGLLGQCIYALTTLTLQRDQEATARAEAERERDIYRTVLEGAGYERLGVLPVKGVEFARALGLAAKASTLAIMAERDTLRAQLAAREGMTVAEQIARLAHRGQVDKAGNPYIQHVERVVARVKGDWRAEAVAWLHDVIEDTMFTEDLLGRFEDDPDIMSAVDTLTRDKSFQSYEEYIWGVATSGDPLALKVKLADLADHLENPGCPESLRPRYVKALAALHETQEP